MAKNNFFTSTPPAHFVFKKKMKKTKKGFAKVTQGTGWAEFAKAGQTGSSKPEPQNAGSLREEGSLASGHEAVSQA